MASSSPRIRSDPPGAEWFGHRVKGLLTGLLTVFATLRQQMGLRPQALEIVIAENVAAVVRSMEGEVVGVEALKDFSVERVGGVVAGKTMFRDAAHEDAVIVLDAGLFRSDAAAARIGEIQITAHELAHALIGQVRAAGGEPIDGETGAMGCSWTTGSPPGTQVGTSTPDAGRPSQYLRQR